MLGLVEMKETLDRFDFRPRGEIAPALKAFAAFGADGKPPSDDALRNRPWRDIAKGLEGLARAFNALRSSEFVKHQRPGDLRKQLNDVADAARRLAEAINALERPAKDWLTLHTTQIALLSPAPAGKPGPETRLDIAAKRTGRPQATLADLRDSVFAPEKAAALDEFRRLSDEMAQIAARRQAAQQDLDALSARFGKATLEDVPSAQRNAWAAAQARVALEDVAFQKLGPYAPSSKRIVDGLLKRTRDLHALAAATRDVFTSSREIARRAKVGEDVADLIPNDVGSARNPLMPETATFQLAKGLLLAISQVCGPGGLAKVTPNAKGPFLSLLGAVAQYAQGEDEGLPSFERPAETVITWGVSQGMAGLQKGKPRGRNAKR